MNESIQCADFLLSQHQRSTLLSLKTDDKRDVQLGSTYVVGTGLDIKQEGC